jgi:hypothetical protein
MIRMNVNADVLSIRVEALQLDNIINKGNKSIRNTYTAYYHVQPICSLCMWPKVWKFYKGLYKIFNIQ